MKKFLGWLSRIFHRSTSKRAEEILRRLSEYRA